MNIYRSIIRNGVFYDIYLNRYLISSIKSPFIFCAYNLSPLHRKSDKHNESNAGCPFASNTHLKIDGAKTTPLNNIFHVVYMI